MEFNQATQTFLLFIVIFISILSGFAYKFRGCKKTEPSAFESAIQTSILLTGILSLFIFGGSYYFVLSDADPSEQPLKDALTVTASYFGGMATLSAAYIASKLFNDWKEQHNYSVKSAEALNIFKSLELFIIKSANYSNSACNINKINEQFKDTQKTILDKDINLADEFLELKNLKDLIVVDIRSFAKLNEISPRDLGLISFTEYYAEYFNFITDHYIKTDTPIDDFFIYRTSEFKKQVPVLINVIQSRLQDKIIVKPNIQPEY